MLEYFSVESHVSLFVQCYSLFTIGYRLMSFNDCNDAASELMAVCPISAENIKITFVFFFTCAGNQRSKERLDKQRNQIIALHYIILIMFCVYTMVLIAT